MGVARRLARPLSAALVLSGVLPTLTASVAAAPVAKPRPPSASPFYRYDGTRPLGLIRPGTILKQRKVKVALSGANTPVTATQLLYRTRDELGRPAVTVTTVFTPTARSTGSHIVGYLSFYDGLGSKCDPSYRLRGGDPGTAADREQDRLETTLIEQYLDAGDIVTEPDFEGEHLDWLAGQEAGWSTLDSIRATESYLRLPITTKVGLTGFSGGSEGAEWASELAPTYSPLMNLVGVAEVGVPVDLARNLTYINGSKQWSGVIPAALVSLSRAFGIRLHKYLSPFGAKVAHRIHAECIGAFNSPGQRLRLRQLVKPRYRHLLTTTVFRRVLNHVLMGTAPGRPRGPLFMAMGDSDGKGDGIMIVNDMLALAHEYCQQGVAVQFKLYRGDRHAVAFLKAEPVIASFLAERFAGVPFASGCASIRPGHPLRPVPKPDVASGRLRERLARPRGTVPVPA